MLKPHNEAPTMRINGGTRLQLGERKFKLLSQLFVLGGFTAPKHRLGEKMRAGLQKSTCSVEALRQDRNFCGAWFPPGKCWPG